MPQVIKIADLMVGFLIDPKDWRRANDRIRRLSEKPIIVNMKVNSDGVKKDVERITQEQIRGLDKVQDLRTKNDRATENAIKREMNLWTNSRRIVQRIEDGFASNNRKNIQYNAQLERMNMSNMQKNIRFNAQLQRSAEAERRKAAREAQKAINDETNLFRRSRQMMQQIENQNAANFRKNAQLNARIEKMNMADMRTNLRFNAQLQRQVAAAQRQAAREATAALKAQTDQAKLMLTQVNTIGLAWRNSTKDTGAIRSTRRELALMTPILQNHLRAVNQQLATYNRMSSLTKQQTAHFAQLTAQANTYNQALNKANMTLANIKKLQNPNPNPGPAGASGSNMGMFLSGANALGAFNGMGMYAGEMALLGIGMSKAGKTAVALGLAAGATAIAMNDVKNAAATLQQELKGISSVTNMAADDMDLMKTNIQNLSKELPVTTTQLNDIARNAALMGVEGVEDISNFTKQIAQLGVATRANNKTFEDMGQISTEIAIFLNETGTTVQSFGKDLQGVIEALAAVDQVTPGTISSTLRLAKYMAAGSVTLGLSQKSIIAISGALSGLGANAEAGGSAVIRVLMKMERAAGAPIEQFGALAETIGMTQEELLGMMGDNPAAAAEAFAKQMGVTADEFQKLVHSDPAQAFQMLANGLNKSSKAGKDMTAILDSLGLANIRDIRLVDQLTVGNDLLRRSIEAAMNSGTRAHGLQNRVAAATDNYIDKMTKLNNAFIVFKQNVGGPVVDSLTNLLQIYEKVRKETDLARDATDKFAKFKPGDDGVVFFVKTLHNSMMALGDMIGWVADKFNKLTDHIMKGISKTVILTTLMKNNVIGNDRKSMIDASIDYDKRPEHYDALYKRVLGEELAREEISAEGRAQRLAALNNKLGTTNPLAPYGGGAATPADVTLRPESAANTGAAYADIIIDHMTKSIKGDPKITAWCADVVSQMMLELGYEVKASVNAGQLRKNVIAAGGKVISGADARAGDVVFWKGIDPSTNRPYGAGSGNHVEMVAGHNDNGQMMVLGSNTGPGVTAKRMYDPKQATIYRLPGGKLYGNTPGVADKIVQQPGPAAGHTNDRTNTLAQSNAYTAKEIATGQKLYDQWRKSQKDMTSQGRIDEANSLKAINAFKRKHAAAWKQIVDSNKRAEAELARQAKEAAKYADMAGVSIEVFNKYRVRALELAKQEEVANKSKDPLVLNKFKNDYAEYAKKGKDAVKVFDIVSAAYGNTLTKNKGGKSNAEKYNDILGQQNKQYNDLMLTQYKTQQKLAEENAKKLQGVRDQAIKAAGEDTAQILKIEQESSEGIKKAQLEALDAKEKTARRQLEIDKGDALNKAGELFQGDPEGLARRNATIMAEYRRQSLAIDAETANERFVINSEAENRITDAMKTATDKQTSLAKDRNQQNRQLSQQYYDNQADLAKYNVKVLEAARDEALKGAEDDFDAQYQIEVAYADKIDAARRESIRAQLVASKRANEAAKAQAAAEAATLYKGDPSGLKRRMAQINQVYNDNNTILYQKAFNDELEVTNDRIGRFADLSKESMTAYNADVQETIQTLGDMSDKALDSIEVTARATRNAQLLSAVISEKGIRKEARTANAQQNKIALQQTDAQEAADTVAAMQIEYDRLLVAAGDNAEARLAIVNKYAPIIRDATIDAAQAAKDAAITEENTRYREELRIAQEKGFSIEQVEAKHSANYRKIERDFNSSSLAANRAYSDALNEVIANGTEEQLNTQLQYLDDMTGVERKALRASLQNQKIKYEAMGDEGVASIQRIMVALKQLDDLDKNIGRNFLKELNDSAKDVAANLEKSFKSLRPAGDPSDARQAGDRAVEGIDDYMDSINKDKEQLNKNFDAIENPTDADRKAYSDRLNLLNGFLTRAKSLSAEVRIEAEKAFADEFKKINRDIDLKGKQDDNQFAYDSRQIDEGTYIEERTRLELEANENIYNDDLAAAKDNVYKKIEAFKKYDAEKKRISRAGALAINEYEAKLAEEFIRERIEADTAELERRKTANAVAPKDYFKERYELQLRTASAVYAEDMRLAGLNIDLQEKAYRTYLDTKAQLDFDYLNDTKAYEREVNNKIIQDALSDEAAELEQRKTARQISDRDYINAKYDQATNAAEQQYREEMELAGENTDAQEEAYRNYLAAIKAAAFANTNEIYDHEKQVARDTYQRNAESRQAQLERDQERGRLTNRQYIDRKYNQDKLGAEQTLSQGLEDAGVDLDAQAAAYAVYTEKIKQLDHDVYIARKKDMEDIEQHIMDAMTSIVSLFGNDKISKIFEAGKQLYNNVKQGAVNVAKVAMNPGDIKAWADLAVNVFNALDSVFTMIEELDPAIAKWKKAQKELIEVQNKALSSIEKRGGKFYNGMFASPYAEALQKDVLDREKKANASFWQKLGWAFFGGAPEVMADQAAETLSKLQTIFGTLANGISTSFEDSMYNAFLAGNWDELEENLRKDMTESIVRPIIRTMIEAAVATGTMGEDLKAITEAINTGNYDALPGLIDNAINHGMEAMNALKPSLERLPGFGMNKKEEDTGVFNDNNLKELFGNGPDLQFSAVPTDLMNGFKDIRIGGERILQASENIERAALHIMGKATNGNNGGGTPQSGLAPLRL